MDAIAQHMPAAYVQYPGYICSTYLAAEMLVGAVPAAGVGKECPPRRTL